MKNKHRIVKKIEKLKQTMLNELTRISSQSCDTPDKAIEQRIRLDQISVEITHLEELLK